ncbi:MAG: glycosyltransferase, partial [Hyphomicrobiales bacterium]|nr:glycosyltransferase [Hyphomicrobiales bacterium]
MSSIDVAIPNYNYGRFLESCVASAQAQDIDGLRILILDNGSTDGSLRTAYELAAGDSRIEVVAYPTNRGMHAAFNACIDWCSSPYMTILHADDRLAPGALKRARDHLDQCPEVVMTYGCTGWSDQQPSMDPRLKWKNIPGHRFIDGLCKTAANPVACAGVVMRTEAQQRVGHYDPQVAFAPDLEMWLRMASVGDIGRCSSVQGIVGRHEDNASATTRERLGKELLEIEIAFEAFFRKQELVGLTTHDRRRQLRRAIGERAYWAAIAHYLRGSKEGAAELK